MILAPWIVRLVRSLTDERAERIRSQERAEMAAHLHDSVLQTLALVQQRSEDPRAVAALARRQERELRAWLSRRAPSAGRAAAPGGALETAASEVERDHGVTVDVVAVGDADLDDARRRARRRRPRGDGQRGQVRRRVGRRRLRRGARRRPAGLRPRPRAGLPARRRAGRPARRARVDRRAHGAPRRAAPRSTRRPARAPRSS